VEAPRTMPNSPVYVAVLCTVSALIPVSACALDPTDEPVAGAGGAAAGRGGTSAAGTGGATAGKGGSVSAGTGGSGSGGRAGTSGSGGVGGAAGSNSSGTGGVLTAGSGGRGGMGGSTSAGAGGGAGTAAGGGAGAGGSSGGAAGSSGSGGGAADPSDGCGKGGRPGNGTVTVANDHIYTFPSTYDGMDPFPLFIGMHAAGNPIDQIQNLTNGSDLATKYVRAFPKSAGNEWNYNNDLDKVVGMYEDLLENYCIDKNRIFSAGHSSGAQMIVQILTHADAAELIPFKAVAPVAASNYGAITRSVAVMYIQGEADNVRRSDGADVVARFTAANSCSTMSMPYTGVAGCSSSGTTVDPGCIVYQDCDQPTVWCSHNDPQYSNTNHGWPCFATRAMYDFFEAQP
jgi:polyhydroxybutyrate depolymerase